MQTQGTQSRIARTTQIEPDAKITDLIGRLTDDSKRLVSNEVRLAKMEIADSARAGVRGMLWMGLAFGVTVIALVALTIFLATGIGRLVGNLWAGALIAGALELGIGLWLVKRGAGALGEPPYTLAETRHELKETVTWVANARDQRAD